MTRKINDQKFRMATRQDVPAIVAMLADDKLGSKRECCTDPLPSAYYQAFEAIHTDPNNELIIMHQNDQVAGMLQLTFIPCLTYQGSWRALIEGVRIARAIRGEGAGHQLLQWAIKRAKKKGCHLIQLTTDKQRPDALRFYQSLGFQATHEGMKLHLTSES